jgi:hypothetical protein
MDGIRANIANKKLIFAPTGDVAEIVGEKEQVQGKWTSQASDKDNVIRYTLGGVPQKPLAAQYSFNKFNQLVVVLTTPSGDTKPFTFPGRIEVDSNHLFKYRIIDSTGADLGALFILNGSIGFAENTVNLVVDLLGGGQAVVRGTSGIQSLETFKNHMAEFKGDDLLTFRARTINMFEGSSQPIVKPAIVDFVGEWDLDEGTLVFISQIKGSPEKPALSLGFGGKFKAVTAGFVYFADSQGKKAVLNIGGRHVFRGGQGDLTWQSTIGFSERNFDAQLKVKSFIPRSGGQSFALEGGLVLRKEDGKPMTIDLSLEAKYQFENGILVFKADISNGIQPSYDLMLTGDFKYSNLKLAFQINLTGAANAKKFEVSVGVEGNRDSMIKHLALLLNISESQAKVQVDFSFEARIRFVDGVRVKEIAKAA